METADLLKKVRKIEIKTKGLSSHLFSGEYHSAFKGRGMSFSEVRDYHYGDDVRNIDWNVTARTGRPHVKVFEEERELTVMLLIDVSGSSMFGSISATKKEILTEISAVLAFSAINNNDKVGVLFFSDHVERYIPPKKGRKHILRIIRELLDFEASGRKTDLSEAFQFFNNVLKKKSIVFVLSDFATKDYERALRIVARKHDLIGLQLTDPREEKIPNVGLIQAEDPETGKIQWMDTSSSGLRKKYEEVFQGYQQYFKSTFLKSGAEVVQIKTNASYVNALLKFFQKRAGI
ncbi:MAG: DUF58 domain-containing protein [Saprospiraceae bacterium]|nr:DUF58 domain-containing protein [Saprospiraceae bacterium]